MCRWVLVLTALVLAGCSTHHKPAAPVAYGYAWTEQQQLDLHDECMAAILKDAPRDATMKELNLWLYECKRNNGNSAF